MICAGKIISIVRGFFFFSSAAVSMICIMSGLSSASAPDSKEVSKKIGKLQVPFIANNGQMDEKVGFYAKTFGGTVFVTKGGEIVYSLPEKVSEHDSRARKGIYREKAGGKELKTTSALKGIALKESLIDGKIIEVKGEKKSETKVSYFKGNDPSKHKSNLSAYNVVSMGEVYKGIELKLRAYGNNVEKLFYVKPGADAGNIRLKMEGPKEIKVNDKGELELLTEIGTISFTKPVAYQEVNGKRVEVAVEYILHKNIADDVSSIKDESGFNSELSTPSSQLVYCFKLGAYDKTKELVIDPLLASTFIGGTGDDRAFALAIDSSDNVFITGWTSSTDYPTTSGAYDTSNNGNGSYMGDVVVSKFNNNLTSLLASAFIGGSGGEQAYSLAIDSSGNVFVTGGTSSIDYPTTQGAYDTSINGGNTYGDAYISKLDNNLTGLLASTFIGGSNDDVAYALTIDSSGNVFVTGWTSSIDYPTTQEAYDTSFNGGGSYYRKGDVFVSKLNNNLANLLASTFIGGSDYDEGAYTIAIDSSSNVFVAGDTFSPDYPTTSGAYDISFNGGIGNDVFISKLNNNLSSLLASTFIGGNGYEGAEALAIDTSDNVFVAGNTGSSDYPTTSGAYGSSFNGWSDVFVSKLNNNLTSLLASTVIGGSGGEQAHALAIDPVGNVFVAGETMSTNYPTTFGSFSTSYNDDYIQWSWTYYGDIFISKLNNSLTSLLASTYIGGDGYDVASALAINSLGNVFTAGFTSDGCCMTLSNKDSLGNVFAVGYIYLSNFPTTSGAYDTSFNGSSDAVIIKIDGNLSEGGSLTNVCPAILADDLTIHVPIALYSSKYYTAYMQYTSGMDFKLTYKSQLTNTRPYTFCLSSAPTVAPDMSIHMPMLMFDGISYWADFQYNGNLTWTMINTGAN